MGNWKPIETSPLYRSVLLYRMGDLHPVVGFRLDGIDGTHWIYEETGPEDGEHRRYAFADYAPTHWREYPTLPAPDGGAHVPPDTEKRHGRADEGPQRRPDGG